jgi:hypothetical protein
MLCYLVLVMFGGGIQFNPALAVIPTTLTCSECEVRGMEWKKSADDFRSGSTYKCIRFDPYPR